MSKNSTYAYFVCLCGALFYFYEMVQLMSTNTLSAQLIKVLSLSTKEFGILSSSFLYATAVALLPAGLLLDRFSTRYLLTVISALATISALFLAMTSSYHVALLSKIGLGIANAFASLAYLRLVSQWFSEDKVTFIMSIVCTFGSFAAIVAQTPFYYLIQMAGYRGALYVNASIGAVITLLIFTIVRDLPHERSVIRIMDSIWQAAKNYQNWLYGLYPALFNLPGILIGGFIGELFFTQGRHFASNIAGNITSFLFVGALLGMPFVGWLSGKIGKKRRIMIAYSLLSIPLMGALIYLQLDPTQLMVIIFAFGFFSSGQVLCYPLVSFNNPPEIESTALSIVSIVMNSLTGISQMLLTTILNLASDKKIENGIIIYSLGDYQVALTLLPLALCLACLVAVLIKERLTPVMPQHVYYS